MSDKIKIQDKQGIREHDLDTLIDTFFSSIRISDNTKKCYRFAIEQFFEWYRFNGMYRDLIPAVIVAYTESDIFNYNKATNVTKGKRIMVSTATQSLHFSGLKRFFRWLEANRIFPDITSGIEIKNEASGAYVRKPLKTTEIKMLLDSIDISTIVGRRNYAIINLMARTGIREIEVHRADAGDIKNSNTDIFANDGKLLFYIQRKGKKSKSDFVVLTQDAYRPILDYSMDRGLYKETDPLFITHGNKKKGSRMSIKSIQDMIYETIKKCGIKRPDISGHSIRHFFATQLIEKNVNIENIRVAMGHESIATTSRYTKGMDRLKNPVEERIEI